MPVQQRRSAAQQAPQWFAVPVHYDLAAQRFAVSVQQQRSRSAMFTFKIKNCLNLNSISHVNPFQLTNSFLGEGSM